jgi:hypothetical protein
MKTLKDHTIFYDDECPMCNVYTKAFVKTGMLDKQGREPYSLAVDTIAYVDWHKAKNEIALVNRKTHEVSYGIDAMLQVLIHRFPFLQLLKKNPLIEKALWQLYYFISYNRKVIAPGSVFEGKNTCAPDFNLAYRIVYIVLTWFITSLILTRYAQLAESLVPASDFFREFIVCGGQLLFQGLILSFVKRDRVIHYLGNVMTISFAGSLALLPAFLLTSIIHTPWFYIGWFIVVVVIMFFEHLRRVSILELPWFVSATWVLYRLLVLGIILSL